MTLNRSKSPRLARRLFLTIFLAQAVSAHLALMSAASHAFLTVEVLAPKRNSNLNLVNWMLFVLIFLSGVLGWAIDDDVVFVDNINDGEDSFLGWNENDSANFDVFSENHFWISSSVSST